MSMRDAVSKYGEWIYRGVLLAGMAAILYLNQNYVTRAEFNAKMTANDVKADSESKANISAHLAIQTSISDIASTMKLMATTTAKTDDHEMRLRIVEARQIDVISRLSIQERSTDRIQQDLNRKAP